MSNNNSASCNREMQSQGSRNSPALRWIKFPAPYLYLISGNSFLCYYKNRKEKRDRPVSQSLIQVSSTIPPRRWPIWISTKTQNGKTAIFKFWIPRTALIFCPPPNYENPSVSMSAGSQPVQSSAAWRATGISACDRSGIPCFQTKNPKG